MLGQKAAELNMKATLVLIKDSVGLTGSGPYVNSDVPEAEESPAWFLFTGW